MRLLIPAFASVVGSVAFQMSVDAGYIRHFTWAVPWLWGVCAALWIAWLLTHDRIVKQWFKSFHERVGRGIHLIRVSICTVVFLTVSLTLQSCIKPQPQTATKAAPATATEDTSLQKSEPDNPPEKKPHNPKTRKPPSIVPAQTQTCAPGAQCAQSSGQSGGFTGQVNLGAVDRHLSPAIAAALTGIFNDIPKNHDINDDIGIIYVRDDGEAQTFAYELARALQTSAVGGDEWNPEIPKGVLVVAHDDDDSKVPFAHKIAAAISSGGIKPIGIWIDSTATRSGQLRIIVGKNTDGKAVVGFATAIHSH